MQVEAPRDNTRARQGGDDSQEHGEGAGEVSADGGSGMREAFEPEDKENRSQQVCQILSGQERLWFHRINAFS